MDIFLFLRSLEVFEDFDDRALGRIAQASQLTAFTDGQSIFTRGQSIEALGVVVGGRIRVILEGSEGVQHEGINPGEIFGEIGLLTGGPSVAGGVAEGSTRVVMAPNSIVTKEFGNCPQAMRSLIRVLTERLAAVKVELPVHWDTAGSEARRARSEQLIPIGVSAHHVHLCDKDVETLFGPGHKLTPRTPLSQDGYYSCEETLDLVGPKGRVERVRILGPARPYTQVEISRTEEFRLGIDAPIRASGDLLGSPGLLLLGGTGELNIDQGVICALRHIHMGPERAVAMDIRDRDVVRVKIGGERSVIFGDVLVRVFPGWNLEMHIDTDEANAAEVTAGMTATIESVQKRSPVASG